MTKRFFAEDLNTTNNVDDDDALVKNMNMNHCMTQEELDEYGFILGDDLVLPDCDEEDLLKEDDADMNMAIDVDDPATNAPTTTTTTTLTGRPPIQLYLSCNPDHLSEFQCLIRKGIELFEASHVEVASTAKGRNRKLVLGQVGIQCMYCHYLPPKERVRGAMYYPQKLPGIYQAAQILANTHLMQSCPCVPAAVKEQLHQLKNSKTSGFVNAGKEYWGITARALGVYEAHDGLRFERALGVYEHQPNPMSEPNTILTHTQHGV
jgi:hypothetical protein